MKTTRTRLPYITLFAFTAGLLLMGASPLAAQDDCKVMMKALSDAFHKVHTVPTHVYTTSKIGSQTFNAEMIYAAGSLYLKMAGKWTLSGSTKDMEEDEHQAAKKANSTDTCRQIADEPVNGEMASVYTSHSESSKGKVDIEVWISKDKGLVLKQNTNSAGTLISARYDYTNVKPPI